MSETPFRKIKRADNRNRGSRGPAAVVRDKETREEQFRTRGYYEFAFPVARGGSQRKKKITLFR